MRAFTAADNSAPTGALDRFVRRFPTLSHGAAGTVLYTTVVTALGLAAAPAVFVVARLAPLLLRADHWWRWPAFGVLVSAALFVWGFALLVVVPAFNALLPTRLRASSGGYFTGAALPWYLHNGLFYLVRFTFLPFVTMTPIGTLFLRAMGMKLGKRVRITTENLSDVCLITVGDDAAIGGSATIFCHFGGNGRLVIAPVVIGSRATIGERATVMGDVVIGEGATILPHAVLLPGTRVGARERWGGAPARRISRDEWAAMKIASGLGLPVTSVADVVGTDKRETVTVSHR